MTRIELPEDYAQPRRVTVGHTLLRMTIGGILIAHGVQRLLGFDAWVDEIAVKLALLEPLLPAQVVVGVEIASGVGLVVGWFTRLSSLGLLASVAFSIALETMHLAHPPLRLFELRQLFELPALLSMGGLYCFLAGGGPVSLDEWLHNRRRLKAIMNDERWSQYPYVPPPYDDVPAAGYGRYSFSQEEPLPPEHDGPPLLAASNEDRREDYDAYEREREDAYGYDRLPEDGSQEYERPREDAYEESGEREHSDFRELSDREDEQPRDPRRRVGGSNRN